MDRGFVNEDLLEKNIEQILMYAKEERDILKKIGEVLSTISTSYDSVNDSSFCEGLIDFDKTVEFIYSKRNEYVGVLNKTLTIYRDLSGETASMFGKGV